MDDSYTLFYSLPVSAQALMRAAVNHKNPASLRELTRTVYPYVQTLADAQSIAGFLATEASSRTEVYRPVSRKNEAVGFIQRAWRSEMHG